MANIYVANNVYQGTSITANTFYEAQGAFTLGSSNQFQGSVWALKNSVIANGINSVLGSASYRICDKNGSVVPGMDESGISADANGQYKITPVIYIKSKFRSLFSISNNRS